MKPLAWGRHVSESFRARVYAMCEKFGWGEDYASWVMSCMAFESGGTFAPDVRNAAGSGATGLIQFMPTTAQDLGTDTHTLSLMTAEEQLDYVERYFEPYARKIKSLSDMYMAILLPKYIGHSDDDVLFWSGVSYRQNSGLDSNHDGKVTKGEASARVMEKLRKGLLPDNAFE